MKFNLTLVLVLIISLALAACASPAPVASPAVETPRSPTSVAESTPTPPAEVDLSIDYPDATSLRNQLAYGILQLEATPYPVSAEQAKALLPLWQAMLALSGADSTAAEELTAVQVQIAEALAPQQLEAIAAMQLTNADLNAFYAEHGVAVSTPAPGVTKVPGKGKNLSPEAKEATQAAAAALGTPVGTGNSTGQAAKTLLFDTVIELLTARAAQ